jgi:dTDP-4-amino-4,6-dideoxygalactose transaminase
MSRLPEIVEARRDNARVLSEGLRELEGLVLPSEADGRRHVFHQYTVRVTEDARLTRDELHHRLETKGIGCGVYYPRPVFDYACFHRDPRIGEPSTPRAARVAEEVLSIPVHPNLTPGDLQAIIGSIRAGLR